MMGYLKRASFGKKLIVIFFVTVMCPLLLNTLLSYYFSSRIIEIEMLDHLQSLASVTMSKVEMSVENVENVSFFIAGNEKMQGILGKDAVIEGRLEKYRQYQEAKDLISYYVLLSGEISSIYIQAQDGRLFSYTKVNQALPMEELQETRNHWKCHKGHIYLKRNLYRFSDQAPLGSMVTEVKAPVFYNIIKDISGIADSQVFIVDEEYNIISCKDRTRIGEKLGEEYFPEDMEQGEGSLHKVKMEGKNYGVYVGKEIHNGWRLVLAQPEDYYLKDIRILRNFILFVAFLTGTAAIILIMILGKSVTRPLKQLSDAMEHVSQGDFAVSLPVQSEDEIGVLSRTFNQMVEDMHTLINNMYEQEMMKQEVEMKSLQMQINPHFLYNTLDTINWIGRLKGVTEVGEMTSALGNLMRYSLSKKDFVTIEEELENLKNYIGIQNVRYGDRMSIEFEVEEQVKKYYIPKLLVQPILENAIVHGVEDKLEPALIQIRIFQEGEDLYLVVEDDGVGMTQSAIEELMNLDYSSRKQGHTSIGVYNVNRRIQAVFGPCCGLQIQSQLGAGTKITLHLKTLTEAPDIHLKYN